MKFFNKLGSIAWLGVRLTVFLLIPVAGLASYVWTGSVFTTVACMFLCSAAAAVMYID